MIFRLFILTLILSSPAFAEPAKLKIFLPREVTVNSEKVELSDITILSGDSTLLNAATNIPIGFVTIGTGQTTIDKNTILSRLASENIYGSQIEFAGADSVSVKRQSLKITGDEILKNAQKAITDAGLDTKCSWKPSTRPKDSLVDCEANQVSIKSAIEYSTQTSIRIKVVISNGNQALDAQLVQFQSQYQCRKAVAIKDIPAGTTISSENTKIETYLSSYPQNNWSEPFGLVARRAIRTHTVISGEMAQTAQSPVIVARNQGVVIQIKKPGLTISAMGEAMQDGKVNEYIKVKNIDSQKVLVAKVNDDGTVEPTY